MPRDLLKLIPALRIHWISEGTLPQGLIEALEPSEVMGHYLACPHCGAPLFANAQATVEKARSVQAFLEAWERAHLMHVCPKEN